MNLKTENELIQELSNAWAMAYAEHAALLDLRRMYDQLLYAVGREYPGEGRHDTALRYIREREAIHESAAQKIIMMHQSKCSMDTPYWANNEHHRRATDA